MAKPVDTQIFDALQTYSTEVSEELQKELENLAKDVKNGLKHNPNIPTRTGAYRKGFFVKKVKKTKEYIHLVIANKLPYLTHLLEYGTGARKRKSGTATGTMPKFPHWEEAQADIDRRSDEIIAKLGRVGK